MLQGRNRHRCSSKPDIGCQQFLDGSKDRDRVFGFSLSGAGRVRLNGRDQRNALTSQFQFAIDAEMIAAKCAGSNDGDATIAFAWDCYAPLPSTARKQRE